MAKTPESPEGARKSSGRRPSDSGASGREAGTKSGVEPGTKSGTKSAKPKGAAAGRAGGSSEPAQRPRRSRPALTSRAAVLALVACAIALSLVYPLREYVAQRGEIASLKEQNQHYKQRVAELSERREELGDPDYIERAARTRLHYRYPGERTYVVLNGAEEDAGTADEDNPSTPWFAELWQSIQEADDPESNDRT